MNLPQRFTDKLAVRENGCWEWLAGRNADGYAAYNPGSSWRGSRTGHRYAYITTVGPVPEGMELDHLCRVRHCVNPAHLEPVSHLENMRRGEVWPSRRLMTECKRGHPLDGDNVKVNDRGWRVCRKCQVIAVQKYQKKKREEGNANAG